MTRTKHIALLITILLLLPSSQLFAGSSVNAEFNDSCNLEEYHNLIMKLTVNLIDNHDLLAKIEDYAKCVSENSADESNLDLAILHIGLKSYGRALINLDNALMNSNHDSLLISKIYLFKATIFALNNQFEFMEPNIRRSINYGALPETWFGLAMIDMGDFEKKLQNRIGYDDCGMPHRIPLLFNSSYFHYALQMKPDLAEAWYYSAIANALSEYGSRDRGFSKAIEQFDSVLTYNPTDYKAWILSGAVHGRKQCFHLEMDSYDSAIKYVPNFPSYWENTRIMQEITNRDETYRKIYNELRSETHRVPSKWPKIFTITNWYSTERGEHLMKLYFFDVAKHNFKFALRNDSSDYRAWIGMGKIHKFYKRREEALACFDSAIKYNPDSYEAITNRADILSKMGKTEEARESYDMALKINSKYAEAWFGKAKTYGLYTDESTSKYKPYSESVKALKKAIKSNPDYLQAMLLLAHYYTLLEKNEKALKIYDKIVSIFPDHAIAWWERSRPLRNLGRKDEANESIIICREIKPGYMVIRPH